MVGENVPVALTRKLGHFILIFHSLVQTNANEDLFHDHLINIV